MDKCATRAGILFLLVKMMKETKGKLDLGTCMPLNNTARRCCTRPGQTSPNELLAGDLTCPSLPSDCCATVEPRRCPRARP